METKVNYSIVGLFVIVLSAAMIVGGIWIAKHGQTKRYTYYQVNMEESVSGLSIHSPVRFNGVIVGSVDKINLNQADPRIVQLRLKIEQGIPITESTVAFLDFQGLTGVCYVELKAKTPNAPPLQKKPGQAYPIITWTPSLALQLNEALRDLTTNFKTVSDSINQLLNPQNQQAIQESLANINKFTAALAANSDAMGRIMKNTAGASEQLPAVLKQARTTLVTIKGTTQDVGQNISDQTLPVTQDALTRLIEVLNNLQQITSQLQNNPSILVRGKQTPPLGPGEK